jgi:alpha-tubulin suppressor-like RCC1 family protein
MLMTTNPTSPANMNMPMVAGMSEQGASVQLFTDSGCTTAIGSAAVAGAGGAFTITISVTDNTATTVYAKATDPAGNVSACSAGLSYVEDSAGPGQPTLNSLPPSNSNTMPTLTGTAEPSTTVYIYASGTCGGAPVAMGAVTGAGTYALGVTVTANTSTQFTAKAVDAANNASLCSSAITYVHDNMAPAKPTGLASNPVSPAGSTAPAITGMAEANATVYLYTNPTCSSSVAGTTTATAGGTFSIPVTVGAGSTTTFYATATDAANNTSACSTASVTYIQDNVPPGPPTAIASVPGSPANNAMPSIIGNAEANSTVKLYTAAGCGAASFKAMGMTNGTGMFNILVSVAANSTTTFYATATDGAGNASTCTTTGYTYVEDATPPATPSGLTTTPPSPANFNNPIIHGTTEAGAAVVAYKDSGCTMMAGNATAAANGAFDITVTVADNTTNTFYMRATDAAMNATTCNAAGSTITYVEDSTAVSPPTLTSTNPTSPSNSSTTPVVNGTSGANFTIKLYTDASCAGALLASGTANAAGSFSVSGFSVPANATTTFYATAFNGVNTSACSSGLAYTHDSVVPGAPTGIAMSPTGPANNNTPVVRGSAENGATIKIYASASCGGAIVGMGPSTGSFNVMVNTGVIADNTTTQFSATATDAAGNVSPCSASVSYIEDSAAPNVPTISSTSPASPANANNPTVNGTAEAGSTVALYTMAGCAGTSIASGTAGVGGAFAIPISVGDNTTTPLFAKAIDAASNASSCTSAAFNYIEDSAPPGVPMLTMVVPAGPANNNNPVVSGTTSESGATIHLYGTAQCNGTVLGTGTSGSGGAFAVTATVVNDTSTVFYANATDSAGNISGCSTTSLSYVEDSTPPSDPQGLAMTPKGPANDNNPVAAGSADAGTTIKLYADDKCLTGVVATTTVDATGKFSVMVPNGVIANDTTVSFSVTSTDSANNVSGCSSPVSYQEDSTANPPQLLSVSPQSPSASSTTPTISGTAEASSTVTLYTNNTCTSTAVGSATTGTGSWTISASAVMPNTSTTYYGKIVDQAGNTSACSTTNVTFISDQAGPTFNGATSAVATAIDKIFVQWTTATDTFTTSSSMRYDICWGTSPRACDSWVTKLTVTGVTNRTITGLNASTRYYFQVRAIDQAGNIGAPSPNVEVSDRTWGPGASTMVSAGYNFACAVQGDGSVQCWGSGTNGQLGNGASSDSLVPVTVSGLVDAVAVSAGGSQSIGTSHVCALKADGTVWCWGYGGNGNLGNGFAGSSNVPVQVMISISPTVIPLTNATAVTSGGGHSCALIADGTIRCWGRNSDGQLGDGTSTQKNVATLVSGGITTFASLDAGAYHTCATLADGTARCWGQNTFGQLGNGNNTGQLAPVTVSLTGADRAKSIDVGDYHSCALIFNGTVRCWGANTTGQLGNATTTNSNVPVAVQAGGGVNLSTVSSIAAGGANVGGAIQGTSCAVLANGSMKCWGYNGFGELGNGNTTNQLIAGSVSGVATAVRAAVGADFTCGLSANGTIACAGDGGNGRLGNNSTTSSSTPVAVQNLYGVEGVTGIASGSYTTCARFSNGRARCWGYNNTGQIGNNTTGVDQPYPETPVLQTGNVLTNVVQVSTFYYHGCALIVDGTVRCWGYNAYGGLGNGTTTDSAQAVTVSGVTNAIQITTGFFHACALISDGTIKCWGYNVIGQLGNNSTSNSSTAVSVMSISTATSVIGAGNTTCALLADGSAMCWGGNGNGQVGDMTTTNRLVPAVVTGIANATSIGGGGYHSCAVIANGTMKCWGAGGNGQMGNGLTNATNSTPVTATGSNFARASGGMYNACATKGDGHAYCWGYNSNAQVDGSGMSPISTPVVVSGVATVARTATGFHSTALLADGTADAWGDGQYGQCGDGNTAAHNVTSAASVFYLP